MRAVVTGAARGIGAVIASRLEADDIDVIRVDVAGETEHCDITDETALLELKSRLGPVDVLVNNAGLRGHGDLLSVSTEELRRVLEVNLFGSLFCTRVFGRGMVERGIGSIVNITSIWGLMPIPAAGTYGISKAGLVALTQQTALDWAHAGVRCNAVAPGLIDTEGSTPVYKDSSRTAAIPMGRLGITSEIAEAVAFLSSEKASYVTGQVLNVDGGMAQALYRLIPLPNLQPDSTSAEINKRR
jgi:NAD(P)-dependent dehydrogenase (short-subunit alcohol dehydrogenase family)